jgi:hypothetical protein
VCVDLCHMSNLTALTNGMVIWWQAGCSYESCKECFRTGKWYNSLRDHMHRVLMVYGTRMVSIARTSLERPFYNNPASLFCKTVGSYPSPCFMLSPPSWPASRRSPPATPEPLWLWFVSSCSTPTSSSIWSSSPHAYPRSLKLGVVVLSTCMPWG